MRLAACALAALLAFTSAPALAEAPAPPTVAKPADWAERVNQGLILARLTQPEDEVLSAALKQLDDSLVKRSRRNPTCRRSRPNIPAS